ncbi:MAG: hypothetical protein KJ623_03385 [Nanoarchaeota archaeon]|nr:hypothetical protein [Nanoarchaeota archaeon]MBU0962798.1 hypothetical protein [Nanoarchaeota archaeon]
MKCPHCNETIKRSKFCSECGKEIETGLSQEQKKYLKSKKTGYAVAGAVSGVAGGINIFIGVFLIIIGILLSLTIILAVIGIPLIIIGIVTLGIGGASAHAGSKAGKKAEEINDKLHGIK